MKLEMQTGNVQRLKILTDLSYHRPKFPSEVHPYPRERAEVRGNAFYTSPRMVQWQLVRRVEFREVLRY